MPHVFDFLDALWFILVESGVWLIVGFAFAGVVHAFVPSGWVTKQLGGRGLGSIVKASLLGLPLPLCSCSVIPVAAGLRRDGASKGASAAFAVSTPQTGEESIPLTWALFGPWFALSRPIAAVATAMATGLAVEAVEGDHDEVADDLPPIDDGGCCGGGGVGGDVRLAEIPMMPMTPTVIAEAQQESGSSGGCCGSAGEDQSANGIMLGGKLGSKFRSAVRHGFGTMLIDLAPWLAIGLVAAAAVSAFVPSDWIGSNIGSPWVQMLAMLIVGVPVYVCATSSTPLAYALVMAGLSPGAAIVLLLSGPATNTATIAWVVKDLGKRAAIAYVATIAGMSLAVGALFHVFLSDRLVLAAEGSMHEHGAGIVMLAGGAAFSVLLVVALGFRVANSRLSRSRVFGRLRS